MVKLSANLSMMFTEVGFLDRFAAAASAGFKGVEFLFPYAHPADEVAQAAAEAGVEVVLFNLSPGDWDAGERGMAALPGREGAFRAAMTQALDYAAALSCPRLHAMAGIVPDGADATAARRVYIDNLRWAAAEAGAAGRTILIEPINTKVDMPGYFLSGTRAAEQVIAEVGSDHIALQLDLYHMHIMEGIGLDRIGLLLPHVGHVQIADAPGRHEPGTGRIGYDTLLPALDALGYRGWVGCEYRPQGDTVAGLGWAADYLR